MKPAFFAALLILGTTPCALTQQKHSHKTSLEVAAAVAPDWPQKQLKMGKSEVHVVVQVDGFFGNVIAAQSQESSSTFSESSLSAARLWKFFPSKPNSRQMLTFVFEVFPKNDHRGMASTTFIPPYKVIVERPEE